MKNLNKILALVIVLAMAFSTVAFAGTFSDVADTDSYAEAVEVLAALGLLNGYEDGTFGPAKTITRAEFAAVIVRTLGLEDAATGAFGTSFDDVPANEWYAGYVMMAAQQGIVNGYGDGTFKPSKDVKFEEAVKMLVCALGFQKKFEGVADAYPTAYVAQAHTLGLTTGANQAIGTDASRGVVARLVYNSLDVGKMEQIEYGTDQQWAVPTAASTFLSENLNVAKVEGTVNSIDFANTGVNKLSYTFTKIADQFEDNSGWSSDYVWPNAKLAQENDTKTIAYADGVAPIKHYKTVAFVDMADSANPVIIAMVEKAGANEILTITATQAKTSTGTGGYTAATSSATGTISYFKNSYDEDADDIDVKLAAGCTVYTNNNFVPDSNFATRYAQGYYPVVTLINNDNQTGYDVIYATEYFAGVVDEINDRINRLTFDGITLGGAAALTLNPTAEDLTFDIYDEEGNAIDFADIKVGDVVNAFKSVDADNNTYYEVIVTSTKLEGTISENNGNDYYDIDGEEHYSYVPLTAGDKGLFYVDMFGKVLKFELSEDSNRNFAVLYATYVDNNGLDSEPKAVLYTANGEFVEYGFAKNININVASAAPSTDKYQTVAKTALTTGSNPVVMSSVLPSAQTIVMYTVNAAGQISEIYWNEVALGTGTVDGIKRRDDNYKAVNTDTTLDTGSFRDSTSKLGGNVLPEDITIIALEDSAYQGTPNRDKFSTADISALIDDETVYTYDLIEDVRNDKVAFAVVFDLKAKVAADSDVMFVTNVSDATDSEGGSAKRFTGYVNGLKTSVIVRSDAYVYNNANKLGYNNANGATQMTLAAVTKGAMIQYNGTEEAKAIRVLATATEVEAWAASASDHGSQITYANAATQGLDNAENDKVGHIYVGKLAEYKNSAAEFTSGADITVSSSTPAMLVRFSTGSIANVYVNDYIVFGVAETNKFLYDTPNADLKDATGAPGTDGVLDTATNGDVVVVYSFDGEALATIILDADNDSKWN